MTAVSQANRRSSTTFSSRPQSNASKRQCGIIVPPTESMPAREFWLALPAKSPRGRVFRFAGTLEGRSISFSRGHQARESRRARSASRLPRPSDLAAFEGGQNRSRQRQRNRQTPARGGGKAGAPRKYLAVEPPGKTAQNRERHRKHLLKLPHRRVTAVLPRPPQPHRNPSQGRGHSQRDPDASPQSVRRPPNRPRFEEHCQSQQANRILQPSPAERAEPGRDLRPVCEHRQHTASRTKQFPVLIS